MLLLTERDRLGSTGRQLSGREMREISPGKGKDSYNKTPESVDHIKH